MTLWHKHAWKARGVHSLQRVQTTLTGQQVCCPVTEVLMVCDCREVKTITLDGNWTLEQVQPAPSEAEADKEFFKKLGVKL